MLSRDNPKINRCVSQACRQHCRHLSNFCLMSLHITRNRKKKEYFFLLHSKWRLARVRFRKLQLLWFVQMWSTQHYIISPKFIQSMAFSPNCLFLALVTPNTVLFLSEQTFWSIRILTLALLSLFRKYSTEQSAHSHTIDALVRFAPNKTKQSINHGPIFILD